MNKKKFLFQVQTTFEVAEKFESYYRAIKATGQKITKSEVLKDCLDCFFENKKNAAIAQAGKSMDDTIKEILSGKKADVQEEKNDDSAANFSSGPFGLPEEKSGVSPEENYDTKLF